MIPPALFFLLKIVLSIWGLLCFHTNFKIICSSSVKIKKYHWYFDKDCVEFVNCLGLYGHFNNINSSNPKT